MIISNIIGGLGNQMFQYAAGRARSLKLGVPLKLDTRDFSGYQLQIYSLMALLNRFAWNFGDDSAFSISGGGPGGRLDGLWDHPASPHAGGRPARILTAVCGDPD